MVDERDQRLPERVEHGCRIASRRIDEPVDDQHPAARPCFEYHPHAGDVIGRRQRKATANLYDRNVMSKCTQPRNDVPIITVAAGRRIDGAWDDECDRYGDHRGRSAS